MPGIDKESPGDERLKTLHGQCNEGVTQRMKKKIIALMLVGTLCLSLAACGEGRVKTSQDDSFERKMLNIEDDAKNGSGTETEDAEVYQLGIPDAVTNISPEDDKALTGVLTEDSYINEYFGLKINKVEGGTIESLMDSGTDLLPLSKTYTEGSGSIMINSRGAGNEGSLSMTVSALSSEDLGKDEKELAQAHYDLEQGINEAMSYKSESSVETITLAGEEHPAYVEITNGAEGRSKSAAIYVIKGDFLSTINIYAPEDNFDEILTLIEKY